MAEAAGEHATKEHTVAKAELVEEVTRVTELPRKESESVVEAIFESIIAALQADDKIEIRGFGSFRTRQRRGRTGSDYCRGRLVSRIKPGNGTRALLVGLLGVWAERWRALCGQGTARGQVKTSPDAPSASLGTLLRRTGAKGAQRSMSQRQRERCIPASLSITPERSG